VPELACLAKKRQLLVIVASVHEPLLQVADGEHAFVNSNIAVVPSRSTPRPTAYIQPRLVHPCGKSAAQDVW
jgi:hypothetical protein